MGRDVPTSSALKRHCVHGAAGCFWQMEGDYATAEDKLAAIQTELLHNGITD
jgi:hypothetical protein